MRPQHVEPHPRRDVGMGEGRGRDIPRQNSPGKRTGCRIQRQPNPPPRGCQTREDLTMILFDLLLWLGVIGFSLLLVVCAVAGLFVPDDCPAGPQRDSRRRAGNNGRRPSDSLPVVLFPSVDRAAPEVRGPCIKVRGQSARQPRSVRRYESRPYPGRLQLKPRPPSPTFGGEFPAANVKLL